MKKLLFTLLLAAGTITAWAGEKHGGQYPGNTIWAVGNATSAGWLNGTTTLLYKIAEKKYQGFVWFTGTQDGELKFLCQDDWNEMWGPAANGTPITAAGTYDIRYHSDGYGDDQKFKPTITGLYLVTLDLTTANSEQVTFKQWTSTGDGADIYEIGNLSQLKAFADCVNKFDATINGKLTADIGDNSNKLDYAIGWYNNDSDCKLYSGNFDGNYKSIKLDISASGNNNKGLFGAITNGAYIHDVTVTGSVTGGNYVAGIVGSVRGNGGSVNISNCKNEATISGGQNTAGIVGVNVWPGEGKSYCQTNILYCYNTGNITGTSASALISGWIGNGSIKYTYASGTLTGNETNREFSRYGTCEFYANVTMTGSSSTGGAYYFNPSDATYTINDIDQFLCIATMVNVGGLNTKNFNLTANIDASAKEYTPIGTSTYNYQGILDGQGHYVNLNLSKTTEDNIGLIGFAGGGATIRNLILKGSVTGKAFVGGFVGCVYGSGTLTFERCGNEADITASGANAGGLLGCNFSVSVPLSISNCYNRGDISAGSESGQLTGWSENATIKNSYTVGECTNCDGFARLGGTNNTITNCYSDVDLDWTGHPTYVTSSQVSSGELCAKLGYAFRQTLGTGYPCFDETLGFVSQIGDAGYSTMFNKYSDVVIPGSIEAFAGVKNGEEWLRLVPITGNIAKDEPVILRGDAGLYNFMPTTGISKAANNNLKGSNGSVTGGDGIYALAIKSDVVGFYPVNSGVKIPEGRAYLNDGSSVKGFTFIFDDDATAIESLTPALSEGEGAIYNVAGQRIQKMQKGINIVNGKKILK